jgi:hypothetical protein
MPDDPLPVKDGRRAALQPTPRIPTMSFKQFAARRIAIR